MTASENNAAPDAVPFYFSPYHIPNAPIDFPAASAPLSMGPTFNGGADEHHQQGSNNTNAILWRWMADLIHRAELMHWSFILNVTDDATGVRHHLLRDFAAVSLAQVRAHAETYLAQGQDSRHKQNSAALYECLYHSMEDNLRNKVTFNPSAYTIQVMSDDGHQQAHYTDGPCFLKIILEHLFTSSSAMCARKQLHELDRYMLQSYEMKDGDISKFHHHVDILIHHLLMRNQVIPDEDLVCYLMAGYAACSDKNFARFMSEHYENIRYCNNPINTSEQVMHLAMQFWTDRKNNGTWNKPTREQEQIMHLQRLVKELRRQQLQDNKTNESSSRPRKNTSSAAWKWIPPPKNRGQTKVVNQTTYHWCLNHKHQDTGTWGMWVTHELSECRLAG